MSRFFYFPEDIVGTKGENIDADFRLANISIGQLGPNIFRYLAGGPALCRNIADQRHRHRAVCIHKIFARKRRLVIDDDANLVGNAQMIILVRRHRRSGRRGFLCKCSTIQRQ
ncbi:hypothetical protein ATB93_12140 [Sphingomonas sp. WG]|nr:hypothetical protein ATB93_12140 [Sphingomonas sp. WG]